jgi:integrase
VFRLTRSPLSGVRLCEPLLTGTALMIMLHGPTWRQVLSMRGLSDIVIGWWTIPAERAKNGHTHRVPLSLQAQRLLENLRTQGSGSPWAFPHPQRQEQPMTRLDPAALRVRRKTGVEFAPHDLRRTAALHDRHGDFG